MPHLYSYEAIIIGAGFAGCLQALHLARAGLRVALLERQSPAALTTPTADGRTVAIAAGNIPLLDTCGVWDRLRPASGEISSILVKDAASGADCHFTPPDNKPLGYIVDNVALRGALLEQVASSGVDLHTDFSVEHLRADAAGSEVGNDAQRWRADILIGADGKHSAVRRALNIGSRWHNYGCQAIVAVLAHSRPHQGQAYEVFLPTGPLALLPLSEKQSAMIWTWPNDKAATMAALPPDVFAHAVTHHIGDSLGDCRLISGRRLYALSAHVSEPCYTAGAVLIADAAHSLHPIAGQGLNLGMRDVSTLTDHLLAQRRRGLPLGAPSLLASYQAARAGDVQLMLAATHALNGLFENRLPPVRWLRGAGLSLVDQWPSLKQRFMNHATGLSAALRAA